MDAAGLAIAITGCVLKLVAFSVDFVVDVKQVYHKGATDRNRDLAIVANSIQDAAKTLEGQLDDFSKQGQVGSMDPAEKDIRALATRATAIGNELASRLKKVHADTKSKQKALETVIRGMWDAEEIETIEKQLNGIRNEIQLRLLIDIRRLIQESHSDEFHHMVLALERTAHSLMDSKKDSGTVMELLSQINGSIKDLQKSINATPAADERSTGLAREGLTKEQFMRVQRKAEDYILGWLWYPSIHDRKESIEEAHSETLNWIYDNPKTGDKSCTWDSFASFLTSEASMYWITGKPGSGKSTLMKFITEQPRTAELLQLWAGDKEVLFASFYFFYKGSNEQKTELGLLRSLLYWILSRRKVLIPVVFKERFTAVFERIRYNELEGISYNELKGIKYDEPTLPEARRALRHLFREIPHLCFFLTIDGLDEFDPGVSLTHVTSLIELTKMLGIFENVKIVVSSRQLPEFEQGFEACPHLRIHELTRRDIHHYATEKLGSHRYMNKLIRRDPVNSRALIESVTTMSCGVFLWVRVVTQSLLQGLTNRDTIHDLQQRLEGLPSDLLDLYKVMLERVDQRYRNQTCQLLQLVYHGILEDPEQLSALGLWFAERADHNMVVQTKTKPINDEVAEDRVDEIESRLKSRCLGLVEVQPGPKSIYNGKERCGVDENLTRSMVVFSHRTVREFLRSSIWEEFTKMHCHPSFNPQESLLRSAILLIKTYRPRGKNDWSVISSLINAVRMRARNLEGENEAADPELLQQFDSAVAINLARHSDYVRDMGDKDGTTISHWSKYFFREYHGLYKIMPPELIYRYPREDTQPSFLSFAIKSGLENYVANQIKIHGPDVLMKQGVPLLGHALCPNDTVVETRIGVVKALLDSGSDPQQTFEGMSLWAWFWHMLFYRFGIETQMTYSCPQWVLNVGEKGIFPIMRLMLIAGAEPNVLIPWMSYPDKAGKGKWDYCTPLVAMSRLREFLLDDEFITEKHHSILGYDNRIRRKRLEDLVVEIEKVIALLKDRGGTRKRMGCKKSPPFAMAKTPFDTTKNRSAWVKKSFTYMKTIVKG